MPGLTARVPARGNVAADLQLVAITLIAACGWLLSKYALQDFSPFTFLALRFLLAAAVLLPFAWTTLRGLSASQWWRSVLAGTVFTAGMLVWVLAVARSTALGVGAFIISLNVVMVPLLSRLLFGHRIPRLLGLALLPAVAGLALLSPPGVAGLGVDQVLFLCSMAFVALHLTLSSYFVTNIPPIPLATVQLLVAGVLAGSTAVVTEDWRPELPPSAWALLVASAVFATSLRFYIQAAVMQKVAASHASMIFLAEPIWTAVLAALLMQHHMSAGQLVGCGLILAAVLVYRSADLARLLRYVRR